MEMFSIMSIHKLVLGFLLYLKLISDIVLVNQTCRAT